MRKPIQRALLALMVAVATLTLATPASAEPAPFSCGGYETVASHRTAAGNLYSTQVNVCLFDATGTLDLGVVARFKCFRNGVLYGEGTGGCRWTWNQVLQRSPNHITWESLRSNDFCVTCGGSYVADSGRKYGTTRYSLNPGYTFRGATRSTATQAYQVRFYLADGTTVLKNMAVSLSAYYEPVP